MKKPLQIFLFLIVTFSYFSQGGNYSSNAIVGEVRSIVERGTFEISGYPTGDIAHYQGKIFSNKSPGSAFMAMAAYWGFYHAATIVGADTRSAGYQLAASHFITFFVASLWGASCAILLYLILRHMFPDTGERSRLFLALFIPLSTLLFPYSTAAFKHAFESFALLICLYAVLLFLERKDIRKAFFFGISSGLFILSNPLQIIFLPFFYYVLLAGKKMKTPPLLVAYHIALAIPVLPLLIYNYINFDNPFASNPRYNDPWMTDPDFFMGVFGIPEPLRIFKILFWSYKSLFPVQAHLLLFIPGFYIIFRKRALRSQVTLFVLLVLAFHALFVSSFNGWHGGLCYGERYITAALMLLAILSVPVYRLYPGTVAAMMVLSYAALLMVTAVDIIWGGNLDHPFWQYSLPNFLRGNIAINPTPLFSNPPVPAAYNIGQLLGLSGLWSLLPLVGFQAILLYDIFHERLTERS